MTVIGGVKVHKSRASGQRLREVKKLSGELDVPARRVIGFGLWAHRAQPPKQKTKTKKKTGNDTLMCPVGKNTRVGGRPNNSPSYWQHAPPGQESDMKYNCPVSPLCPGGR